MGSLSPPLIDFFQPELESQLSFWEESRKNTLINRTNYGITRTTRPTMRSVMQGFSPTDLIEVITPGIDDPVRMWDEGFDWDDWGSYADTQLMAEARGGIPFTIHDGDDGDRDYLRIPMGRVNRWGSHIMTKASYDRLLAWSQLESPFNDYDNGQVINSSMDKTKKIRIGNHNITPLNVQGGELVRERDDDPDWD